MNLLKSTLAAAVLLAALPTFAQSTTWKIDPAHSGADFSIRHLSVSTVRGKLTGAIGEVVWDATDVSKSHVEATLDSATINTNEIKRDTHLKSADFFDVEKYPKITFKSTSVKRNGTGKLQIVGDLTIGGQTKPITLDVDGPSAPQPGQNGKTLSGFSASGLLSRANFNFGTKYKELILSDEVKFTIDLEVNR